MRKLASIRVIRELRPINWATQIELAIIDGWQTVVKKGEFCPGDLCVYCEIDTVLPNISAFNFLEKFQFTVKTLKMRDTLSQGIIFPLSIITEALQELDQPKRDTYDKFMLDNNFKFIPGMDVSDFIGATLLPEQEFSDASIRGAFPHNVPKTEEDRVQNVVDYINGWKNLVFTATEKIDGTSASFMILEDGLHICSHTVDLKIDTDSIYTKIARELEIEKKLYKINNGRPIAIQGEIAGPGIHKNSLSLNTLKFFIFNIYDINNQQYLDQDHLKMVADSVELQTVPVVYDNVKLQDLTFDELLASADGESKISPNKFREGLVFSHIEPVPKKSQFGRISFKIVSNKYLLTA